MGYIGPAETRELVVRRLEQYGHQVTGTIIFVLMGTASYPNQHETVP